MNLALPWSNSLPQKFYCCCSNLLLPQDLCTCYAFCLEVSPSDYLPVLFRWFSGKESTCQCTRFRRLEFDPGSGRSPGGGNGNPFQYSCLGNPIDRGAWQATVHGVTKSQTQLNENACTGTHSPSLSTQVPPPRRCFPDCLALIFFPNAHHLEMVISHYHTYLFTFCPSL